MAYVHTPNGHQDRSLYTVRLCARVNNEIILAPGTKYKIIGITT